MNLSDKKCKPMGAIIIYGENNINILNDREHNTITQKRSWNFLNVAQNIEWNSCQRTDPFSGLGLFLD